tara:strand:+ start:109399 stop:110880 length:1482 start_codon:yes stop_codon:yes gene_type:complete
VAAAATGQKTGVTVIRFNLNGRWIESTDIDPACTILKYLRTEVGQTDVKEGCAAGDCGACTVMLGEMTEQGIEYRTLNACIALMANVHNRYLLTPSGIGRAGDLHPAQQAMVDTHGSQCGFCTPGFIMSMANLYQNACINEKQALTDDEIHAALSGNLCRCTGYRPIVDAAKKMAELPKVDVSKISTRAGVQTFDPDTQTLSPQPLQYKDGHRLFMPYTEAQLKALLKAYPDARLWAGGTDIGLEVTQRFSQFDTIICVNRIPELAASQDTGNQLWLGACVTFSQAENELAESFPSFAQLLHRIGSRQIRNMGTLGGNIANASPIGDTPPVFLALDAMLEIDGINGRREVPANTFYLGYKKTVMQPGEYLRGIRVNKLSAEETLTTFKISKRYDDDISAVMFALYLKVNNGTIDSARLACGGMAATPLIGEKTSAALTGKPFTMETFKQAADCIEQDYQPISDVRATDKYRIQVTKNLLTKAFIELNQKGDAA